MSGGLGRVFRIQIQLSDTIFELKKATYSSVEAIIQRCRPREIIILESE